MAREGGALLTEQRDFLLADLVEGDVDSRRLSVHEGKFTANGLPGERAHHLLTLYCVHGHLLLLHVEYLKVVEHAL